jgi:four helix bundle protein
VHLFYALTSKFPKEEEYLIKHQIKRASISIPSNIVEGAARDSNKEYIHFLYISLGSVAELDTQLLIAKELNFLNEIDFNEIFEKLNSVEKMSSGLIKYRQLKL